MAARDDLVHWLTELYARSVMVGWDFFSLEGRWDADDVPWDFDGDVRAALRCSTRAVDVGTGGGERLLGHLDALHGQHGVVFATEGWEANLPVARAALRRHGVEALAYDPELGQRMPFDDGSIDLVIARHEAVDPNEFARVLRPGGVFLTQQVDGRDAEELRTWFGGESLSDDVTLANQTAALGEAGFRIEQAEDWTGVMRFRDIGTLIEYMAMVPWDVPDFSPDEHREELHRLAPLRSIEVSQRRFRITAVREA